MRICIDIGGTFTDFIAQDSSGRILLYKTLTTPQDYTEGIRTGLANLRVPANEVDMCVHGTTIAINTIIERKGARTALVTTKGFRDVLEIGRGNRPNSYNLFFNKADPLIPRSLRLEVTERANSRGEILTALDSKEAAEMAAKIADTDVEAVSVCFLHSYNNPANEESLGKMLRERLPHVYITLSHELLREAREYERTSTTAINAYVGPRVSKYLRSMKGVLKESGHESPVFVMESNGGVMSLDEAILKPANMMESGPVAGVVGAGWVAKGLGLEKAISFDMGGTTAKSSFLQNGDPKVSTGYYIGGYETGLPLMLPVVDILEVGAGGGSIAWIDEGVSLKVGPLSAGSEPGPASYNKGGTEPTVTDADIFLGRTNRDHFCGGEVKLDPDLGKRAIENSVARPLGLNLLESALGITRIIDTSMSLAVRQISVERGEDPRDCTLIAYGGAGPLHAVAIASELSISRVVIPPAPGNFSALGMLFTQLRHDYVRTCFHPSFANTDLGQIESVFRDMQKEAERTLGAEGAIQGTLHVTRTLDLRYRGQEYTLPIQLPEGPLNEEKRRTIRELFDAHHQARYRHHAKAEDIQIVNARISAVGKVSQDEVAQLDRIGELSFRSSRPRAVDGPKFRRVCFELSTGFSPCPVYDRETLNPNQQIPGPALIDEATSTTVIPPGWDAKVGAGGCLIIEHRTSGRG
ncbi:MAG TPA: hydantoinase/oxoprolinase family protein [bacterium]|nr:hydantoinase/oxoprolinase family protein [bacterium]